MSHTSLLGQIGSSFEATQIEPPWGCDRWSAEGGQDLFVYSSFFSQLEPKVRPMFFVDIGASDGLQNSKTAALEFCFGWEGLLVEPDPRAFASLQRNRPRSSLKHGCLAKSAGDDLVKDSNGRAFVGCDDIPALLREFSLHHVDFFALDTGGGAELSILSGMDWSSTGPFVDVISVFAKSRHRREIRQLLQSHGFEFSRRLGLDDIYRRVPRRLFGGFKGLHPAGWRECTFMPPVYLRDEEGRKTVFRWSDLKGMQIEWLDQFLEKAANHLGGATFATYLADQVAETEEFEDVCPLGVLAARLVSAMAKEVQWVNTWSKDQSRRTVESELALIVYKHDFLLTAKQRLRMWRSAPPQLLHHPRAGSWRTRLPLSRLWIGDFDFYSAARSGWPIFKALDILSRYFQRQAPPVLGYRRSRAVGLCGASLEDLDDITWMQRRLAACGILRIARAHLRRAEQLLREDPGGFAGSTAKVKAYLLTTELALKEAVEGMFGGLYELLFLSGAEKQTIWRELTRVSSLLQANRTEQP